MTTATACPDTPTFRSVTAVAVTAGLLLFGLYWLPQCGATLPSDVTWVYRLQVADPASLPPVPEGLRLFSGDPMGWFEACAAHFQAFRRMNCGDIVLWRLSAIIAGSSAPGWLALSLTLNVAALTVYELVLRRLGTPWPLRLAAIIGLALAPSEVWISSVTSEPRVLLALAIAIAAAVYGRPLLAAVVMALLVSIKEPCIVLWPFVGALSLGAGSSTRTQWRALLPHVALGSLVLAIGIALWFELEARHDYPFLLQTPYPEPGLFLSGAWAGLLPVALRPAGAWAVPTAMGVLFVGIVRSKQLPELAARLLAPAWWLPLLAGLAGLAGHLAVHWLTRRLIGDARYAIPANLVAVTMLLLLLQPFITTSPRWARGCALAVFLGAVIYQFPWRLPELTTLAVVPALAGLGAALLILAIQGATTPKSKGFALIAGVLAGFLVMPLVDQQLQEAAVLLADARSWRIAVDRLVGLPHAAHVTLRTDDVLMIETAWGLQTELLFARRGDIDLVLDPRDTSFYASEAGLVKFAHEAFNRGRVSTADAALAGRTRFVVDLDRRGRRQSGQKPPKPPAEWLRLLLSDPRRFYRERYTAWPAGYLSMTVTEVVQ